MKHARKMILVDASKHDPATSQSNNNNNNNDQLTKAIKSLANSAEFKHFGPSTTVVSRLNDELQSILERKDLDPSSKLKLYNQELKRFLFMHREPRRAINDDDQVEDYHYWPERTASRRSSIIDVDMDSLVNNDDDDDDNLTEYNDIDMQSLIDSEYGAVGGYPRSPVPFTTPPGQAVITPSPARIEKDELFSTPKKRKNPFPLSSPPKRFKSNLPRTTPKHKILRQNRKLKRLGGFDYFLDWVSKRRRKK